MGKRTKIIFWIVLGAILLDALVFGILGGSYTGVYQAGLNAIAGRAFQWGALVHGIIWLSGIFFLIGILLGPPDPKKEKKEEKDFELLEVIDYSEKKDPVPQESEEPEEPENELEKALSPEEKKAEEASEDELEKGRKGFRRGRLFGNKL